jgi:hypothetical protein
LSCSRAIIRKGDCFIASRPSSLGTLLSLHDVQQPSAPIIAAKFWFEGREFLTGSDGCAVIPFMDHDKQSTVVASAPGGYACSKVICFVSESWDANISIISPHEAYVPGCATSILLRCGLYLSSQRLRMSPSELQSPSVSLGGLDEKGSVLQSSTLKVVFDDDSGDLVLPWTFPPGCAVLNVHLTATVAARSSVNRTMSINACASVSMPPSPPSFQAENVAIIQAASTRSDVIVPHLRLSNGRYWLDVGALLIAQYVYFIHRILISMTGPLQFGSSCCRTFV